MAGPNLNFGGYTPTERVVLLSDCTASQRIKLQNKVNENCKGQKSKCFPEDVCPILSSKMDRANKCIQARTKINTKCFKGGDAGHNMAITNAINSLIRCQTYYAKNCQKPQNVPVTNPITIPIAEPNEEFMEMMERLTGLTGAALIIYIIISEGSRIFPPRNLVPIP